MLGNVATGAVAGGLIGGPVEAAIGGFAGLLTWSVGEVVGKCHQLMNTLEQFLMFVNVDYFLIIYTFNSMYI